MSNPNYHHRTSMNKDDRMNQRKKEDYYQIIIVAPWIQSEYSQTTEMIIIIIIWLIDWWMDTTYRIGDFLFLIQHTHHTINKHSNTKYTHKHRNWQWNCSMDCYNIIIKESIIICNKVVVFRIRIFCCCCCWEREGGIME